MADMDVFAAMGISGFGKSTKKKKAVVNIGAFEKNKRVSINIVAFRRSQYVVGKRRIIRD